MFHQPQQNLRQRAAGFACRHQVPVNGRENSRKLTQRLRETPAVHQRLMQHVCHLLHARLFETLFQDRQRLVERHSRLQQMCELLGEDEQLAVRNL